MAEHDQYTPAPIPEDEEERLEQLRLLGILDTGNERRFDRFTQFVADLFDVPISLITLIDSNRQWFKSSCGLGLSETSRDVSFCAHAILEERILIIPDATQDDRFAGNPLVTGPPYIKFYAGAVLRSTDGRALGTLCLIDHNPRILLEKDVNRLLVVASMVEAEMQHEYEFQLQREQAFKNAHFDGVTGLPNSRLFKDRLEQAILQSRRSANRMLVALIQVEGYQDIKYTLGDRVADQLASWFAQQLASALNDFCTVARWRDDTFAVILPSLSHDIEAQALLEHIHRVLVKPFHAHDQSLHIDLVSGAAIYPDNGVSADEILQRADIALRNAGKGAQISWCLYSSEMSASMARQVMLEHQLREAIGKQELSVVYQPIVDLDSNEIHKIEALCRWHSQLVGTISPDEFIPIAEKTNLVIEVDRFVISRAVSFVLDMDRRKGRPLALSMNLSSKSLMHPKLLSWLKEVVIDAGLDASRVVLEVTENSLVADMGLARHNTAQCRKMGFNVTIDDFGTGFSSFNYLKELSVDELKLDRVFVREITQHKRDSAIANSIISLARNLGLTVVAEGIETYDQLIYLNAYHCDEGQGYYFSPPLEPHALMALLEDHRKTGRES